MPSDRRTSRVVVQVLLASAIVILAMVIRPLATSLFLGGVLAGALGPVHERLSARLKGRRNLSAGLLTLGVILALVVPVGGLGAIAVNEAIQGVTYIRQTLVSEGVSGLIMKLPTPLHALGLKIPQLVQQLDLSSSQGASAAAALGGLLSATTQALLQAIFTVIALFFLLTDGARLVRWLDDIIPLRNGHFIQLLNDFRRVSVAVLLSSLVAAGGQTVVAALGYLMAGVPNLLFFTLVTFFVAFIPGVGAAAVSVFLGGLLYLSGHGWKPSLFLVVWGLGVVGLIDNFIKPLFINKGGLELHGAVVFFALIGGLAAFGAVGLLIGPLAVAFFLAAVRMSQREWGPDPSRP